MLITGCKFRGHRGSAKQLWFAKVVKFYVPTCPVFAGPVTYSLATNMYVAITIISYRLNIGNYAYNFYVFVALCALVVSVPSMSSV